MISNIPIYRAKKIDSDEYVEGCLRRISSKIYIQIGLENINEINPSTLEIHFHGDKWRGIKEVQEALKHFDQYHKLFDGEL